MLLGRSVVPLRRCAVAPLFRGVVFRFCSSSVSPWLCCSVVGVGFSVVRVFGCPVVQRLGRPRAPNNGTAENVSIMRVRLFGCSMVVPGGAGQGQPVMDGHAGVLLFRAAAGQWCATTGQRGQPNKCVGGWLCDRSCVRLFGRSVAWRRNRTRARPHDRTKHGTERAENKQHDRPQGTPTENTHNNERCNRIKEQKTQILTDQQK